MYLHLVGDRNVSVFAKYDRKRHYTCVYYSSLFARQQMVG